jgi:hypothetical protein
MEPCTTAARGRAAQGRDSSATTAGVTSSMFQVTLTAAGNGCLTAFQFACAEAAGGWLFHCVAAAIF